MTEIALTRAQGDGGIQVSVGDVLVVRLQENPTTGYRWHVDAASGLVHAEDHFSAASTAPGAGGERILRFTVATPGTLQLRLSLRRSWEAAGAPQDQFKVTIEAR